MKRAGRAPRAAAVALLAGVALASPPARADDRFGSFAELAAATKEGVDWRVEARPSRSPALVLAPHGGGIEAGTSELARAVAGDDHALYLFEGLRPRDNDDLHVTSTRFDEPRLAPLLRAARRVLALHGCQGKEPIAYVGGRDEALGARLTAALQAIDVDARPAPPELAGTARDNVCNRGTTGRGAQLELTRGLRATLVEGLDPAGRKRPAPALQRLADALRRALAE